jgi:O-antigen ligase
MLSTLARKYYYRWSLTADERIVLLLPPATLVFPQSAAACLLAIALVLLVTRFSDYKTILSAAPTLVQSQLAVAVGLFFIWVDLSCLWSPVPEISATRLFKTLTIVAATVFLLAVATTERLPTDRVLRFMSTTTMLCAGLTALLILTYPQVGSLLGVPLSDRQFHRIALVLALLLPLILTHRRFSPALRAGLCLALVGSIFMTTSETAKLAVLVGVSNFLLATLSWPIAIFTIAFACIVLTLLMPLLLPFLQSTIPASLIAMLADAHAAERLAIWREHAQLIPLHPLRGWGIGSTRAVLDYVDPQTLADLKITPIVAIHSHNHILQIWLELGGIGIGLFCTVVIAVLYRINAMSPAIRTAALSLFSTIFAIGIVGHGLWQSWWVALIGGLMVVVLALERREREAQGVIMPTATPAAA